MSLSKTKHQEKYLDGKFDLKRETKNGIESVLSNRSYDECIVWIEETIKRNKYQCEVLTDLHMRPVYRITKSPYGKVNKIFFLKEVHNEKR